MSEHEHQEGCNCSQKTSDAQLLTSQAKEKVNLALAWVIKKRFDAAQVHLAAASRLFSMSGQNANNVNDYFYHHACAALAENRGQHKAAERHARRAFACAKANYGPDTYHISISQANWGECLVRLGKKERGLKLMADGLELFQALDVGADMVAWKEGTVKQISDTIASLS